jgi:hypothetical protein
MTVEAIKDAIVHLSGEERKQLADWLEELEEEAWDRGPGGLGSGARRPVLLERRVQDGGQTGAGSFNLQPDQRVGGALVVLANRFRRA